MGHKASTICLHLDLSCAACCASPQVRFISFSSAVTVRRQVFLGRPCFLFPGGVHRRAILGMRSWSILRTCPSHLNRRRLISSTTLLHLVFLYRCALDIFSGQKIRQSFLRHPLWKASIFSCHEMLLASTPSRTTTQILRYCCRVGPVFLSCIA